MLRRREKRLFIILITAIVIIYCAWLWLCCDSAGMILFCGTMLVEFTFGGGLGDGKGREGKTGREEVVGMS